MLGHVEGTPGAHCPVRRPTEPPPRDTATYASHPASGGGLTSAGATHAAEVAWTLEGEAFTLEVTVPPNTDAEVSLPDGSPPIDVGSGHHSFACTVSEPVSVEATQPIWSSQ
jgi:alpha-L-rhamnosidase